MCGITGKINFNSKAVSTADIKTMTDTIEHRGPDDQGQWVEENIGLGNRRLAIIDLSPKGHMPMFYDHDRYVITFNGEIYNFQDQRKKLIKRGYRFRSGSDTEVILALYAQYGVNCVDHLRGMFAFAIWDRKEKLLFAARDRLGKKPFKYYHDQNCFIFASELKAILTQKEVKTEPDFKAIYHYLSFQYIPSPLTGFTKIKKLPPAHYLLIKGDVVSIHRYWQLDYTKKLALSEEEWQERIIDKLSQSVKLRMIADVPLGAFLSGGVDSSAIVALMAMGSSQPVKTFSIGFKEKKFNELEYAKQVAQLYGTDHTEFIVEPRAVEILPKLIYQYEEPYADSSAIPSYYVSNLTAQHVTVALNGDGGDENFAGYGWYPFYALSESPAFRHMPKFVKDLARKQFDAINAIFPSPLATRASRFAQSLMEENYQRYLRYICYFTEEDKQDLIKKDFYEQHINQNSQDILFARFSQSLANNPLDQALSVDVSSYLPDDLLVKMDIATMANSLETRSPFLDHEFMELAASIPPELKVKGITRKYILKKSLSKLLPPSILHRPKRGFAIPLDNWLKNDLRGLVEQTLLNPNAFINQFVKPGKLEQLLRLQQESSANYDRKVWALLTLELWFQRFFGK